MEVDYGNQEDNMSSENTNNDAEGSEQREKSVEVLVNQLTNDYIGYLDVDSNSDQQVLDETIEEMLTRLDEFCGLVDMIRSDTTLCLKRSLPEIQAKSAHMQKIFYRIDKLEAFVNLVKKNLDALEQHVNKADSEMGSLSSIKKMFSSFLSTKKTSIQRTCDEGDIYIPHEIFKCQDYLPLPRTPAAPVVVTSYEKGEEENNSQAL